MPWRYFTTQKTLGFTYHSNVYTPYIRTYAGNTHHLLIMLYIIMSAIKTYHCCHRRYAWNARRRWTQLNAGFNSAYSTDPLASGTRPLLWSAINMARLGRLIIGSAVIFRHTKTFYVAQNSQKNHSGLGYAHAHPTRKAYSWFSNGPLRHGQWRMDV